VNIVISCFQPPETSALSPKQSTLHFTCTLSQEQRQPQVRISTPALGKKQLAL